MDSVFPISAALSVSVTLQGRVHPICIGGIRRGIEVSGVNTGGVSEISEDGR